MTESLTPPRSVTFVIGTLELAGAETQLVRLANGLDRSRFRPAIVCLEGGGGLEALLAPDVPVVKMHLAHITGKKGKARVRKAVRVLAALTNEFRKLKPDLVHGYLPAAYALGAVAARLARVPVMVAGRRGLTAFEGRQQLVGRVTNLLIDLQVCNSEAVREYAIQREGIPRARTRVVYNGIDLPSPTRRPQPPADWKFPGAKAAMVANLRPYKGHRQVLLATAMVARQHPEFRLVLIGDRTETLAAEIRQLGIEAQVILAGRRADAAELMAAFDFTVLGSEHEGFPNVVMESMANSIPVVATGVGGVKELITDRVHGRLVPFGDIKAMAEAMTWMIEHPHERRRMGDAGHERIASEFSTRRMISETESIYDELLNRRRRAVPEPAGDR